MFATSNITAGAHRILYLAPPNFSAALKQSMLRYMRRAELPLMQMSMAELTRGCLKKSGKKTWNAAPEHRPKFLASIQKANPTFIIINDRAALEYITNFRNKSLNIMRGSILYWFNGTTHIPCFVLDDVKALKFRKHAGWVLLNDCKKLKRWIDGKQRPEPAFTLNVCRTVADVEKLYQAATDSLAIGMDVETSGGGRSAIITSSAYTIWGKDGVVCTYVVPFAAPFKEGGCYWENESDELRVFEILREVHQTPAVKVMQNGAYDSHYYIAYRLPVRNYILDTAHIFHSLWPESPKRLDWIASYSCDYYAYWKDEGKEEEKDDNKGKIRLPQTEKGLERYWRYNGLDTHYTLNSSIYLLAVLLHPSNAWALKNYCEEFSAQIGPALRMSLTGVAVNSKLQMTMHERNTLEHIDALNTLRNMVDDQEYNPNSPAQTSSLIYDVLRAKPLPRKGRTTNEKVLKVIQAQSPLLFHVIEQIWNAKKPANNVSKYGVGNLRLMNRRWLYVMNAAGTETGRYASKQSHFWMGTSIQQVPEGMRPIVQADPGFVLFDIDYRQSDAYFTAFESEEPTYMKNVLDDRDLHCVHAAQFFQKDYDELLRGYQNDEEWVTHPIKGIRQITKRVVYGANYLMAAFTLFITMGGKAPVVAAARALGYADAPRWNDTQLVHFCQRLLDFYFQKMYPGLQPWLQEEIQRAIRNGNRATCAFGRTRTFFGNLASDSAAQRELAAFFGQGGTAGNINAAIDNIHNKSDFYKQGGRLLFQGHDSITGEIPQDNLGLLATVVRCMDNECEVKGRRFHVPVDIKVGRGWGKRMLRYVENKTTLADIDAYDAEWLEKFFNGKQEAA